jgi:hypothetical protein
MALLPDESWIKRTGQLWKFQIFIMLFSGALIFVILDIFSIMGRSWAIFAILFIGCGIAELVASVKCPSCKKRPLLRVFMKADINDLTKIIMCSKGCPYCGYDGVLPQIPLDRHGGDVGPSL